MSKSEKEKYFSGLDHETRQWIELCYDKIGSELEKFDNKVSLEFKFRSQNDVPRDVFLWLHGLLGAGEISSSCEPYLADLFWMIH